MEKRDDDAPCITRETCAVRFRWAPLASLTGVFLFAVQGLLAETASPSVSGLAQQLTGADLATRRRAGYELGRLGASAKEAVPALIKALDDPDKQVWSYAAAALAAIGADAAPAIPALLEDLDNRGARGQRRRDRNQALFRSAYALTQIGPAAIPPLIAALGSDETPLRRGAAKALGGMGAAARSGIPALLTNLGNADEDLRREVIEALGLIGADAIPPLAQALASPDPRLRAGGALALAAIGRAANGTGPAMIRLLDAESDPGVRAALLAALPKIRVAVQEAVPLFLEGMRSDHEEIRRAAINSILVVRPAQSTVVPPLIALLQGPDPRFSERAAYVLGRVGAPAVSAIPALIEAASRSSPPSPEYVDALVQLGAPAVPELTRAAETLAPGTLTSEHWMIRCLVTMGEPAVAALIQALAEASEPERLLAIAALGAMGPEARPAAAALLGALDAPEAPVRAAALQAFLAVGGDLQAVLPKVQTSLDDSSPLLRVAAINAVAGLGPGAKPLVPALIKALNDGDESVGAAALAACGALGPVAADAAPALAARLSQRAEQTAIFEALRKMGPAAEPSVPHVVELVKFGDNRVRVRALSLLAAIGSGAAVSLPDLQTALRDGEADVRAAAFTAYSRIEPHPAAQLPVLQAALADAALDVRRAAADAIARLGDKASSSVSTLAPLLKREEDREFTLAALREIGVVSLPPLLEMLESPAPSVCLFACERLGQLGSDAQESRRALEKVAEDPRQLEDIRRSARRALRSITIRR